MKRELAKLTEKHDRAYSDALDALNFEHLQQRLEREADEARAELDLGALNRSLEEEAADAVKEVEALRTARAARATANRRARHARGALKQLKSLAPTTLDQSDDVRVKAATDELEVAEAGLIR